MKNGSVIAAILLEARMRVYSLTLMPESVSLDQYHQEALKILTSQSGLAEPSGIMQDSMIVERNQPFIYQL